MGETQSQFGTCLESGVLELDPSENLQLDGAQLLQMGLPRLELKINKKCKSIYCLLQPQIPELFQR